MFKFLSRIGFMLALTASLPVAAWADCYDVFGCSNRDYFRTRDLLGGPNCEFLYEMRNSIYKEHGYCFNTQRGIQTFGNAGCRFDNVNQVPLSAVERANVSAIASAERTKRCPR